MISGEERSANPAQPITVNLEFALRPDQVSVALLPSVLETLEIDFRIAEDGCRGRAAAGPPAPLPLSYTPRTTNA